jgi:hypothetical protein
VSEFEYTDGITELIRIGIQQGIYPESISSAVASYVHSVKDEDDTPRMAFAMAKRELLDGLSGKQDKGN